MFGNAIICLYVYFVFIGDILYIINKDRMGTLQQGDLVIDRQESRECFFSDVGIRGICLSLTLGTTDKFKQLD